MRTVDKSIKDRLWAIVKPQADTFAYLTTKMKAKRGGKSKEEGQQEAILELCRSMYEAGLDCGYDMGYEVGQGESPDNPNTADEPGEW